MLIGIKWFVCAMALFSVSLWGGTSANAHQPQVLSYSFSEAASSGTFSPGRTSGADDILVIGFSPIPTPMPTPLLLVFPGCGVDPPIAGRPVANLDDVIEKGSAPQYIEWVDPGPKWQVCPTEPAILIQPDANSSFSNSAQVDAFLKFEVDFLNIWSEGTINNATLGMSPQITGMVYEVTSEDVASMDELNDLASMDELDDLALLMHGRQPAAELIVTRHYRLDPAKQTWMAGTYQKIMDRPTKRRLAGLKTYSYDEQKAIIPVDLVDFRSNIPLPRVTKYDDGRRFNRNSSYILGKGSKLAGQKVVTREDIRIPDLDQNTAGSSGSASFGASATSHTIEGKFSTRWSSDSTLHPGFGFKVELWTNETGSWKKLGGSWVESNGTWKVQVNSNKGYSGNQLRVLYRTNNSYYSAQGAGGHKHSWKNDFNGIAANHDIGHWYVDTDGGDHNGLGELLDAAMRMWSRLYWQGSISPVRSSPIIMTAPNTTYDCGAGTGVPWSCSNSSDGQIWLVPQHMAQAPVVAHELAHQLQAEYWDNKRPANSGGSHNLTSCYPTRLGMTLGEGFANFIPAWVGYQNRNTAAGGFGAGRWALSLDPESNVAPPTCANGWEAEVWVARVFWDLHDTRSDGGDVLWFNHMGGVINVYLANGPANNGDALDMRDFENVYRNAASAGHEDFISAIFDLNRH